MSLRPLIPTVLASLVLAGVLAGCQDRQNPSPPPRVPKPKMEHEPVDPIKTGPTQNRHIREV